MSAFTDFPTLRGVTFKEFPRPAFTEFPSSAFTGFPRLPRSDDAVRQPLVARLLLGAQHRPIATAFGLWPAAQTGLEALGVVVPRQGEQRGEALRLFDEVCRTPALAGTVPERVVDHGVGAGPGQYGDGAEDTARSSRPRGAKIQGHELEAPGLHH
jgi:hypothetical protein